MSEGDISAKGPVDVTVGRQAVAFAVFADNGNIRIWSTDSEPVRKLAEDEGLPLVSLYAAPPMHAEWDEDGEAMTLAAAAEDADEWMALIERLHNDGRGPWKFSDATSLEKLRGCRRALRRFLTPNYASERPAACGRSARLES